MQHKPSRFSRSILNTGKIVSMSCADVFRKACKVISPCMFLSNMIYSCGYLMTVSASQCILLGCPNVFSYTGLQSTNARLNIAMTFATAVQTWSVVANFESDTTLTLDEAAGSCTGETCTFTDKGYNGVQNSGNTLTLAGSATFTNTDSIPELLSLTLNGQELCSGIEN